MSLSRQPAMWKAFCLWCLCACYPRAMLEDGWRLHRGKQIPWNLFSPKVPFHATVVANHQLPRVLSPATREAGETCHITLSHHGQVPYLEGQAIGVIAPGPERTGERPAKLRLYSIASSRSGDDQRSKTLSLCVKRVVDVSERDHRGGGGGVGGPKVGGICSNYLCDAQVGEKVVITGPMGNELLLPEETCCNLILVATGTGIAPIRSQLRRLFHDVSAANPDTSRKFTGLAWLFYGVRYASSRLYHDEHNSYRAKFPNNFRYNCAISREGSDSEEKEHVQTQMGQHMDELWRLLQLPNTHIYACGVKGLESSLSDCLASAARDRGQDWRELHKAMRTEGRYHVEVY